MSPFKISFSVRHKSKSTLREEKHSLIFKNPEFHDDQNRKNILTITKKESLERKKFKTFSTSEARIITGKCYEGLTTSFGRAFSYIERLFFLRRAFLHMMKLLDAFQLFQSSNGLSFHKVQKSFLSVQINKNLRKSSFTLNFSSNFSSKYHNPVNLPIWHICFLIFFGSFNF